MPPTSEAGGEADEIGPKADIGTHAAWLADRNSGPRCHALGRLGPPETRSSSLSERLSTW